MPLETARQLDRLNATELNLLQEKACGLTNKEAAVKLKTTTDSVEARLRSISVKLGYTEDTNVTREITNKCTRAVCTVLRNGMIKGSYKGSQAPLFSKRETETVRLVAAGFSTKYIATRLHISVGTIKAHLASAARKSGAKTRTQLAAIAVVHNLI